MPQKKYMDLLCILLYSALGILGAWFVLRYVLPWVAPFLLAFLTASLMEPTVLYLTRNVKFPPVLFSRRMFAACAFGTNGSYNAHFQPRVLRAVCIS